ncbi:hypothetical protein [Reichenbachiella ulvae]|uniref:Uncharacterized protein n=1 Tax=Reichenbachiella ulvae TaxID=2980104 RepID=A0ABT3CUH9_9BACT|nr:hypothetical protein [Reichenbachiella ulvae]MCV9387174.1 hypothetical protein [Reichenbachiella ulvae]
MKKNKYLSVKVIHLLILLLSLGRYYVSAQLNLDSLFLSSDSLVFLHKGFFEEELPNEGIGPVFCYESNMYFFTESREQINGAFATLNFRPSDDVLFCGYDFDILGYNQGREVFDLNYNSECNFASIGIEHYWTDSLDMQNLLRDFIRFKALNCEFRSQLIADCYTESLMQDESLLLLRLERKRELELRYWLMLK